MKVMASEVIRVMHAKIVHGDFTARRTVHEQLSPDNDALLGQCFAVHAKSIRTTPKCRVALLVSLNIGSEYSLVKKGTTFTRPLVCRLT